MGTGGLQNYAKLGLAVYIRRSVVGVVDSLRTGEAGTSVRVVVQLLQDGQLQL